MTHRQSYSRCLAAALAAVLLAAPAVAAWAQEGAEENLPQRFTAYAVSMGTVAPGSSARIDIEVSRWSGDDERQELLQTLQDRGGRSLPDALRQREKVGWIRHRNSLAYDLQYAREHMTEGGRRIVLATDRPLAFVENWTGSRTLDYNVTLIELVLDDKGEGQGALMLGAELSWNAEKSQLVIESFSSEPVRLTRVKMVPVKKKKKKN